MFEVLIEMAMGAFGALVRQIASKAGIIKLPRRLDHDLDLGMVGGCIVGAFCGLLWQLIFPGLAVAGWVAAGAAGYVGADLLENLYQKAKSR